MKSLAQSLSGTIKAKSNCIRSNNTEWQNNHEHKIEGLIGKLPSGFGINDGNEIDYDKSTSEKIVINSAFHTMDENGYYSSWISFRVIIKPTFQSDLNINIVGNFSSNKNAYRLKEYLHEQYSRALNSAV